MKTGYQMLGLIFTWTLMTTAWGGDQEGEHADVAASEAHAVLEQDIGVWDAEMKMWMSPEGGEPMPAKGVETNELMVGGMWVLSEFEGNFAGQDFTGKGQFGYDPTNKKYVGTWIDSMSPHMMKMEGTYDASSKTMTFFAESINPQSGQLIKAKLETKYTSDNERIMTMYMGIPGSDDEYYKHMECKYTRHSS